jgi:hypothetical protein
MGSSKTRKAHQCKRAAQIRKEQSAPRRVSRIDKFVENLKDGFLQAADFQA